MSYAAKTLTLNVGRALDLTQHSIFTQAVQRADSEAVRLVVDLKETEEIRDSGLAMLLMLKDRSDKTGAAIDIVNCKPTMKFLLQKRGFSDGFRFINRSSNLVS